MFLTLQRLIAQSNKFFLRETGQDSDNLKTTLENQPTENLETKHFLPEELKLAKSEVVPFLVRRNLEQLREQRQFEIIGALTNYTSTWVTGGGSDSHEIQDSHEDDAK